MTPQSTIDFSLLLALFSIALAGFSYVKNSKKDNQSEKKDYAKEAEEKAVITVKLDTICNTTNETRSDIKSINKQLTDLMETQILQGQEIKTMWRRVDEHSEKLNEHESKIIELGKEK